MKINFNQPNPVAQLTRGLDVSVDEVRLI